MSPENMPPDAITHGDAWRYFRAVYPKVWSIPDWRAFLAGWKCKAIQRESGFGDLHAAEIRKRLGLR